MIEDWKALTDTELDQTYLDARNELERRRQVRELPEQMDNLHRKFLNAKGIAEGEAWIQPVGARDAYPLNWVVAHGGKMWESTTPGNVWEPGVSGWREVIDEPAPGEQPASSPAWVAPTGAHDAYAIGDRVSFDGVEYESTINGNVWQPGVHGWTPIEETTV